MSDAFTGRSGAEIARDLDRVTQGIERASNRLSRLLTDFHGFDENGEMGTGLEYEVRKEEEISDLYELEKPPPADVREARAKRAVRTKYPELWAKYHKQKAEIEGLRKWLADNKDMKNGLQTLQKAEAA